MVKARTHEIDKNLKALEARFRAVLVYGPDEGLARDRARALIAQFADDPRDAFQVARLAPGDLTPDPARLADELAAIPMLGGRRLVVVESATDALAATIESALGHAEGDGLLIVTAGSLGPRTKLRQLFEGHDAALAVPCYGDEEADLERLIDQVMAAHDLKIAGDARNLLIGYLGADRGVSRRELEKLALYAHGRGDPITVADVEAVVVDSSALALAALSEAVTGGRVQALDTLIDRAFAAGENAVGILRVVGRRFERLHTVQADVAGGKNQATALKALRPPLFFKEEAAFRADLRRWPLAKLNRALETLAEGEIQCKTTGLPAETVCARTCLSLAAGASRPVDPAR